MQSDTTSSCTCICEAACSGEGEVQDADDCSCAVPAPTCDAETDCDGRNADWDMYESALNTDQNECECWAAQDQDPCDEMYGGEYTMNH